VRQIPKHRTTTEQRNFPSRHSAGEKIKQGRFVWGQTLLLASALVSVFVAKAYLWPAHGRFGDAEWGRFVGSVAFVLIFPAMAVLGGFLTLTARKSMGLKFVVLILLLPPLIALAFALPEVLTAFF
jgi:hypothetical protein